MKHIENQSSDHSILLLDTKPVQVKRKKRFLLDKRWIDKPGVEEVVRTAWESDCFGSPMFRVAFKIKRCRQWDRLQGHNSAAKIQKLKEEMEELKKQEGRRDWVKWTELKTQLDRAYKEEESYWSQKSRVQWLKDGDKNTSFFHASVMQRRRSNRIDQLDSLQGGVCAGKEEVLKEVSDYYENLFQSEDVGGWEAKLEGIPTTITAHMNSRIIRPVEDCEIKKATFSMNSNKAPGMDGMTPLFFQSFWHIIQDDICIAVKSFFQSSFMLKSYNHTLLSFIPKIQHPTNISQFRPISLCNIVYKII